MRLLFRSALALAMLLVIAGLVIWRGGWGGMSATHPAYASTELAPLIPVGDFFASTQGAWGYQPSATGKYLSWWEVSRLEPVIRYRPMAGGEVRTIRPRHGARFFWSADDSALYLVQNEPERGTIHWRIDPENPEGQWADVTPKGFLGWWIVHQPLETGERWIVGSTDRVPGLFDLYTIEPDGSGREMIYRNGGKTLNILLDVQGRPVLRQSSVQGGGFVLEYLSAPGKDGDPWAADAVWLESLRYGPDDLAILTKPQGGKVMAMSRRGRDKRVLVEIDIASGTERVVAEEPAVDLLAGYVLSDKPVVDIADFSPGLPVYKALSGHGEKVLSILGEGAEPFQFNVLGSTLTGDKLTIAVSRQEDSWDYLLIDTVAGTSEQLGSSFFKKHAPYLAETIPVEFTARDGKVIPALLTIPKGVEAKGLPAVVLIHGGPAQRYSWGYNHQRQFLANRGYAVLSVNFRGSTGFGKAFQEAGYLQFGRAMQDDIADAAKWLASEGIADPTRIAAYGGSYGGYSALMAVTRDPGLFAAAVSDYGMTNVAAISRDPPEFWEPGMESWTRYFGDPQNDAELQLMEQYSPVNLAEKIGVPVLLTHGLRDPIVSPDQTMAMEQRLKAAGKQVEAHYFPGEGHGYQRWQTEVRHARILEDFLARHLGGRSGGFHYTELGAMVLD